MKNSNERKRSLAAICVGIAFIATIALPNIYAQTDSAMQRLDQANRKQIIEVLKKEAQKFKVEIETESTEIRSGKRGLSVNSRIKNPQKMDEKALKEGYNLSFLFISSSTVPSVQAGYYISRIRRGERGRALNYELLNSAGNVTVLNPVFQGDTPQGGGPQGYIRGTLEDWYNKPAFHNAYKPEVSCYEVFPPQDPNGTPPGKYCGWIFIPY